MRAYNSYLHTISHVQTCSCVAIKLGMVFTISRFQPFKVQNRKKIPKLEMCVEAMCGHQVETLVLSSPEDLLTFILDFACQI